MKSILIVLVVVAIGIATVSIVRPSKKPQLRPTIVKRNHQ